MRSVKIDYGMSCGRHYITIDGEDIYQGSGSAVRILDETVVDLVRALFPDCKWRQPMRWSEVIRAANPPAAQESSHD
jgi:hypothetical protein